MPKKAVSVTLDRENLLWLRGRVTALRRRSLSEALDEVVSAARLGRSAAAPPRRSIIGLVDSPLDDRDLARADEAVRTLFHASVARTARLVRVPAASRKARRT